LCGSSLAVVVGAQEVPDPHAQGLADSVEGAERGIALAAFDLADESGADSGGGGQFFDGEAAVTSFSQPMAEVGDVLVNSLSSWFVDNRPPRFDLVNQSSL
jgi:hypothetical protein